MYTEPYRMLDPSVPDLLPSTQEAMEVQRRIKEKEARLPVINISKVTYGLYTPADIHNLVMLNRTLKDAKKLSAFGTNYSGTVYDPRMGSIERGTCPTCVRPNINCAGHYGYIPLQIPIIHPMFVKEVIKVLRSIMTYGTTHLGKLIISQEELESIGPIYGEARLSQIAALAAKRLTDDAYEIQTDEDNGLMTNRLYDDNADTLENGQIYYFTGKPKKKDKGLRTLMPMSQIIKAFEAISPETNAKLGFGNVRPIDMILRNIIVSPPCSRLPAFRGNKKEEHKVTNNYDHIIDLNQKIQEKLAKYGVDPLTLIESPDRLDAQTLEDVRKSAMKIYTHYQSILYSDSSSTKDNKRESVKDILKDKKGLVRGNLEAARVNFAGRAVVTPEPNLPIGWVSLPEKWRSKLTVPVTVDAENIDRVRYLNSQGELTHISRNFKMVPILPRMDIKIGDTVYRWLQEGDYVILNRNPSLHKTSILGVRTKFHDGDTIHTNLSTMGPIAGDYDGDELNIHAPQTPESIEEVKNLMCLRHNIIDQQTNRPLIGLIYDYPVAAYLMTSGKYKVDKQMWASSVSLMSGSEDLLTLEERLNFHGIFQDENGMYPGNALFSMLLPAKLYYKRGDVLVLDGVLVKGQVSSTDVGKSHRNITQTIANVFGEERAADFLSDAARVLGNWLDIVGYSIGLDDCLVINEEERRALMERTVSSLSQQISGLSEGEVYEENVRRILGGPELIWHEALNPLDLSENKMNIARESGGKGSKLNLAQISVALGQQRVYGERIAMNMSQGTRCSPYFRSGEIDPSARGFCVSSFGSGLSPHEFIYHAMASREGLLNTASLTADIGAMSRRLLKTLQNSIVYPDGSVRNAEGQIVQMAYGHDGLNPKHLLNIPFDSGVLNFFDDIEVLAETFNREHERETK